MKKQHKYFIISTLLVCLGLAGYLLNASTLAQPDNSHTHSHSYHAYEDKIALLKTLFVEDSVILGPEIVECTLSGGAETTCFKITVKSSPADFKTGPWCPRHIDDTANEGGLWIEDDKVYDVDGNFIKHLAEFYGDDEWQMYNPETGEINVTNTAEECAAAARPDVDPEFYNHCVECRIEHIPEGLTMTYTIPLEPVPLDNPDKRPSNGIGISFSGAKIETSAPLHAILDAHTIAAFDDCGGHVNLHVGYHIHAVTGCIKEVDAKLENHPAMIGFAMDGYPLYMKDNQDGTEATGLDQCRGHAEDALGYHYHVAAPGKNAILPCLKAQSGCVSTDPDEYCDASVRRRPPR